MAVQPGTVFQPGNLCSVFLCFYSKVVSEQKLQTKVINLISLMACSERFPFIAMQAECYKNLPIAVLKNHQFLLNISIQGVQQNIQLK